MAYFFLVERGPRPGLQLPIEEGRPQTMGRGSSVDLLLPAEDRRIDPKHVEIVADAAGVHVRLIPHCGPVIVNGASMQEDFDLAAGDTLSLGRTTLRLVADDRVSSFDVDRFEDSERLSVRDIIQGVQALRAMPWREATSGIELHASDVIKDEPPVEPEEELLRCTGCGESGIKPPRPDLWDATWLCARCAKERKQTVMGMPARIGQFNVLRPLARGGMGVVFEGVARDSGLHVAIKVLQPASGTNEKVIQRFAREQQIAKALRHPNIVCCYEVGTWAGSLFIVSQFVSGGDALSLSSPTSSIQHVLWLGADLFRALGYGHDLGIVHRDVKPANLLLCPAGSGATLRGKLADFGLAKGRGNEITAPNEAGGSLLTISPEQLRDFMNMGPSGDLYAAAATVYWMLTARTPLPLLEPVAMATFEQKAQAILGTTRVPLRHFRPDVPQQVATLIDSLVAYDPSTRKRLHAREVAVELNSIASRIARRSARRKAGEALRAAAPVIDETPEARERLRRAPTSVDFKESLETVELCIRMLERAAERAAKNVRDAVASEDPERVDRTVADHEQAQVDLEQVLARWEKLLEAAG